MRSSPLGFTCRLFFKKQFQSGDSDLVFYYTDYQGNPLLANQHNKQYKSMSLSARIHRAKYKKRELAVKLRLASTKQYSKLPLSFE